MLRGRLKSETNSKYENSNNRIMDREKSLCILPQMVLFYERKRENIVGLLLRVIFTDKSS
jgi:hypothetical protein